MLVYLDRLARFTKHRHPFHYPLDSVIKFRVFLLPAGGNILTPESSTESRRALRDLEDTFPHVIRALEHGLLEAREYFDSKPVSFDASVFSTIARLHAREYLRARKLEAADLEVEQVNLCGLWLKVGRYHLKIWKISSDDAAKALQRQTTGHQLPLVDEDGIPIVMDLAIYWTVDGVYQLGHLYLVQPREPDPRCFDWVWSREIVQLPATVESIHSEDIPIEDATVERETDHSQ